MLFVAADAAAQAAEKLADFIAGMFESGLAPAPTRKFTSGELMTDAAARRAFRAQQTAERKSEAALRRMHEDMEAGRRLQAPDVCALTHEHLVGLQNGADEFVRMKVRELEKERERER